MKRKIFALLLFILMLFTFVGCSNVDKIFDKFNIKNENSDEEDKDVTEQKIEERLARLYFFDTTKSELYYVDDKIKVTNNNLIDGLNKGLQSNNYSENFIIMSELAQLESVNLDNNTGVLTVKYKNNFFEKMNIGDVSESGFYAALITTYAYNYGIDKVALYQNNELYTGMRGELPEGYNEVSFADAKKFVKEEYDKDKVEEKPCRLFFYTGNEDKIYYVDSKMEVTDKAILNALTNSLKSAPNEIFYSLAEDVSVTKATLDTDNSLLTVDLSPSYYNILTKVGSGSEAGVLNSLAYTYGNYYGVDKVIIKVGGKNYSGSHITFDDGQYIKVDTTDITEYNN